MPRSCALLGGFAIGARVALLWQHNANRSYKLAFVSDIAVARSMPSSKVVWLRRCVQHNMARYAVKRHVIIVTVQNVSVIRYTDFDITLTFWPGYRQWLELIHLNLLKIFHIVLFLYTYTSSGYVDSPLSSSMTHSLFHSRLKTYLFHKSFPP